jgi:hypothetical protein
MRLAEFRYIPLFLVVLCLCSPPARAGNSADFVLKGRILDTNGKPAAGGEVFVYDNAKTKRPADFISTKTDRDGVYRIVLPAGKYWTVARVRSDERYGPLTPAGRHSGEAQEIEGIAGGESILDFIVAEVREMARFQHKSGEECRTVEGRILDRNGKPVRNAYAFARKEKNGSSLPDFISPWSDAQGFYTLCVPAGRYFIGASTTYPPEGGVSVTELLMNADKIDIANDIRMNYTTGEKKVEENQQGKEID